MTKNLFIILSSLFCATVIIGCQPNRGCTDPFSDNFDSEAKQDDDTCIPTRLKFVGVYDAYGTIETGQDTLVAYDQVAVNVVDTTAIEQDGLIIGISNFDAQLYALSAKTTGQHSLMIVPQTLGVYSYTGDGTISGRVFELKMTRTELITLPDETTYLDTLFLNLYSIKEID